MHNTLDTLFGTDRDQTPTDQQDLTLQYLSLWCASHGAPPPSRFNAIQDALPHCRLLPGSTDLPSNARCYVDATPFQIETDAFWRSDFDLPNVTVKSTTSLTLSGAYIAESCRSQQLSSFLGCVHIGATELLQYVAAFFPDEMEMPLHAALYGEVPSSWTRHSDEGVPPPFRRDGGADTWSVYRHTATHLRVAPVLASSFSAAAHLLKVLHKIGAALRSAIFESVSALRRELEQSAIFTVTDVGHTWPRTTTQHLTMDSLLPSLHYALESTREWSMEVYGRDYLTLLLTIGEVTALAGPLEGGPAKADVWLRPWDSKFSIGSFHLESWRDYVKRQQEDIRYACLTPCDVSDAFEAATRTPLRPRFTYSEGVDMQQYPGTRDEVQSMLTVIGMLYASRFYIWMTQKAARDSTDGDDTTTRAELELEAVAAMMPASLRRRLDTWLTKDLGHETH